MLLNCGSSRISRATSAHFISSSHCASRAVICFRTPAAWPIKASSNSCTDCRLTESRYSPRLLSTHHPLGSLRAKKNSNIVQMFALSTLPLAILSTRPSWVGATNPMGQERKPFTIKLDADNSAWLTQLQNSCLPLEVSKSSLVNSLVTIARTQIQVTPASVQITPRNLSVNDLGVPGGQACLTREGSVCQELPINTPSGGFTDSTDKRTSVVPPSAAKSVEYPDAALPQKLRRAERAS